MFEQLLQLAEYLETCNEKMPCTNIIPAYITIAGDKVLRAGARYTQDGQEKWYILGALPRGHRYSSEQRDGTIYVSETDKYYVSCYLKKDAPLALQQKPFHPFGSWFGMCVCPADFQPMDVDHAPEVGIDFSLTNIRELRLIVESAFDISAR